MSTQGNNGDYGQGNPPEFGNAMAGGAFGVPSAPAQDPPMIHYRGNTLQQSFYMRDRMKLSREKPMIGCCMSATTGVDIARIVGQAGYDYVWIDWEHTPFNIHEVCNIIKEIQYAGEGNTAVIVRLPSHEHYYSAWILDAGASAVILPHTETVEQAKQAVKNARMPQKGGMRSGPPGALLLGYNDAAPNGGNMIDVWDRAGVIIQIESKVGAENAQAIAAVEGVDGLMVGPGDLAFDLGLSGGFAQDPTWRENVLKVTKAAKDHNLACLMPSFFPQVKAHLDLGFTMVMTAFDALILTKGLRESLATGHTMLEEWKKEQKGEVEGEKEKEKNGN